MFNKKSFSLRVVVDEINGMSELWCVQEGEGDFRFSVQEGGVDRGELFEKIAMLEDRMHEHSLVSDMGIIFDTLQSKGFIEEFEEDEHGSQVALDFDL